MKEESVVITGVGPVSPIGSGKDAFWDSLINGKSGIDKITKFDPALFDCKIAGEINDLDLRATFPRGTSHKRYPRSVELAIAAANLAIQDAKMELDTHDPDRIGVFVGTSVANLAETFVGRDGWLKEKRLRPDSSFHVFNHSAACLVSSLFDLRGPTLTVTTGCNSGLDALGQASRAIQSKAADAMLVVGTDCEVFPEIMASLNASNSLSTKYNNTPKDSPRPFDVNRDGVVLAEGAAAFLLERESTAKQRGAHIYARFSGYANCAAGRNRSYSTSPELDTQPAVNAMRIAVREADWKENDVDLVHANGSGSIPYDRLESQALQKVFGARFPDLRVHSIKSMIGLPGGAASAMQVITACLCFRNCKVPPTINHDLCDPNCGPIRIVREPESYQPDRILVHTIGLGGFYYSAAAISSIDGS